MEYVGEIESVAHALKQVTGLIESKVDHQEKSTGRRRFGFWFRGQVDCSWDVTPAVYRDHGFEEANMFEHFRVLRPEYQATHKMDFDWLTLMQHFGAPTRLVDWTENLLVGLFFALWQQGCGEPETDGALFVLSARKLNHTITKSKDIAVPDSFHVAMRTALARSQTEEEWLLHMLDARFLKSSVGADKYESIKAQSQKLLREELFSAPVAVFPGRRNDRLVAQAGVFTIHGGKIGVDKKLLPASKGLEEVNRAQPGDHQFLWKFCVRNAKRKEILDQLNIVGVRQGTLFPDLDHQAKYLRDLWKIP